jgi:predicted metal-dependent HD superfamily phosphohydrolase
MPKGLSVNDAADLAGLLDIDLSILAARPEVFDRYERDVRAGYAVVPEHVFRTGRAGLLKAFQERPRLYFTEAAHRDWESAARANLARSIAALTGES